MYRQIPLAMVADKEFVPQAILGVPPSALAELRGLDFVKAYDDLDRFDGAAVSVEDKIPVLLKRYDGYPHNTTTLYLPAEITDVDQITSLIRFVLERMWIPVEWITWERVNDPAL